MHENISKLICVSYALGRTGSSSVMGLLKLADVDIGKENLMINEAKFNPKGYFELRNQQHFLVNTYPEFYPNIFNTPTINQIDDIAFKNYKQYEALLHESFTGESVAIKGMRMLTIPFLYKLRNSFDIKVIVLDRKLKDQVNSTIRVWEQSDKKEYANEEFITEYIFKWKKFANEVMQFYDFNYHKLQFEDLINQPIKTTNSLFEFLEIPPPKNTEINSWIDSNLVNRDTIE